MPDMSLFDVLDRLSSLTRMWFRQHPLLADLQPVQLSALMYLAWVQPLFQYAAWRNGLPWPHQRHRIAIAEAARKQRTDCS